jgi:TonB family protein
MVKSFLFLLLSLMFIKATNGQQTHSIYYLKSSGALVSTKDQADFFVEISLPDSAHKDAFIVNGYYLDGKKLFSAYSLTKSFPLKLQGRYTTYFRNGNKMSARDFENGELTGEQTRYYPNGRFYNKQSYVTTLDTTELLLQDCSDSTGNVLTKNGNGIWINYNDNFTLEIEKGKVVNGLRDSVWTIAEAYGGPYKEVYKNGKIFNNPSEDQKIFTSVEQVPEFPGGIAAFYTFLNKNIQYPTDARRNNTQGRVIISFVVEKDGSLTNVKVARGIGDGCDEEAVRVIKSCPKWKPGMQNGRSVRVAYSVPISFALGNNKWYLLYFGWHNVKTRFNVHFVFILF